MSEQQSPRNVGGAERQESAPPRIHRPDVVVAAIVLVICALLFLRTFWFDEVPSSLAQNVQPTMFPRLVLIVIAVVALLLPFEFRAKQKRGIDLDEGRRQGPRPIVYMTAAALVIFVGVMPWLGTFAGLLLIAGVLPVMWGERRLKILVPYVVIFPTAVLWLFSQMLQVTFLPGVVGHIFR